MSKSDALWAATHGARYRHGSWFVWEDCEGEFHAFKMDDKSVIDANGKVKPDSKVFLIGGGGPHSMVFHRFGASIIRMWARNAEAGLLMS